MRGRANKVTKPSKQRPPSRPDSVIQDAVDHLTAAAHALQHHHQPDEDHLTDPDQHHDDHEESHRQIHDGEPQHQQVDLKHEHHLYPDAPPSHEDDSNPDVDDAHALHRVQQHQRQLGLVADVASDPASALPPAADPSIHPALQAFSTAAQFASLAQQEEMDAQMQDAVGAAAAAASVAAAAAGSPGPVQTAAERLMSQPGRRLALQRRKEQKLNLVRRSNVEALLAHVSGQQAASACKNCHKGHGPWTVCVVVDGQMCGSCANCWYNASGARCSFHETNNPQGHQPAVLPPAPNPAASFGLPQLAPAGVIQLPPGVLAHDPSLSHVPYDSEAKVVMDRAMALAREATTRKARQLLKVEIAAKQLVLSMLEYEEIVQTENQLHQQHHQLQQQQHHHRAQDLRATSHPGVQVRQQITGEPGTVPDASMEGGEEDGT
ncbi:unnamed protein product [Parascedosporium putredinis]|uniref:Uncharacterized protein n=1 Tax=Parascedosporium putredinis TaxID=1442378 RepID=A0A9P1HCA4_9PEZI|nr:unnamed protein product [Parascedosporium putredinis]CAI8003085.1 unnamed protein product [Parascedosporium putredinis]